MDREFFYNFIKNQSLAVISTVNDDFKPEAALIGFAVSKNLEIIFDTVKTSRKYQNLLTNSHVALVIGWDNETTVQYEGIAVALAGVEDDHYREIYFEVYPNGRDRAITWPDIVHFKVTPTWIRYSNFNGPVMIKEIREPI